MSPILNKEWLRMVFMFATIATSTTSHADKFYFVHNDHLGTPQVITDINKNVVWEVDREPWGNITHQITNTLPNNVSLPGQYEDAETNYSDNWHRTYDKNLGQYLQSDPIGVAYGFIDPAIQYSRFGEFLDADEIKMVSLISLRDGGINHSYAYANQNPVMEVDFMGLMGIGPSQCGHYPAGSPLQSLCQNWPFPDGPWTNCARKCVGDAYGSGWGLLGYAGAHPICWFVCTFPDCQKPSNLATD